MNLESALIEAFPEGISYDDAVNLCLRIYCCVDGVPLSLHDECSKEGLSEVFANLYRKGSILGPTSSSVLYGANYHSCSDTGHWIEVIASIFKKQMSYDSVKAQELVGKLGKKAG